MDYELLAGNTLCAKYKDGKLNIVNEKLAPMFITDFHKWVKSRAISENRGYVARLLRTSAELPMQADAFDTAMKNNAACITDNYWVRENGSNLKYKDVNCDSYNGEFAQLALGVDTDLRNYSSSKNPELTNIGNSNKAWVVKGNRWLYKRQPLNECYNEILASKVAQKLGINTVKYELVSATEPDPMKGRWGLIRSKDFTQGKNINLEHANLILEHYNTNENDISKNVEIFQKYGCEKEYLDIKYLDIVVGNGDRHSRNYGVLRSQESGEVIGLAPNYDNNFAFTRDLHIVSFTEVANQYGYKPPTLTENDVKELKEEMASIGFDAENQLQEVKSKQQYFSNEIYTHGEKYQGKVYVKPHIRNGHNVRGYWRNKRNV